MLTEIGRPTKKERQKPSPFMFTPPPKKPHNENRTPLNDASDPTFVPQAPTDNMSGVSGAAFTERVRVELGITGLGFYNVNPGRGDFNLNRRSG